MTELTAGLGVTVTAEVATIAGTTLATATLAGIESVTVDLAVAQPLSIALGEQKGQPRHRPDDHQQVGRA